MMTGLIQLLHDYRKSMPGMACNRRHPLNTSSSGRPGGEQRAGASILCSVQPSDQLLGPVIWCLGGVAPVDVLSTGLGVPTLFSARTVLYMRYCHRGFRLCWVVWTCPRLFEIPAHDHKRPPPMEELDHEAYHPFSSKIGTGWAASQPNASRLRHLDVIDKQNGHAMRSHNCLNQRHTTADAVGQSWCPAAKWAANKTCKSVPGLLSAVE